MHPFHAIIENIPNFPKKGITFKNIFPLLKDHLEEVIEEMGKDINWQEIDYVAGIESRGFILGMGLAMKFKKGFVPIRKKGKLPPPFVSETYTLEYGEDIIEMQPSKEKKNIIIVDDVLATGGTMKAAIKLCRSANFEVKDLCVLINLKFLNSFEKEGINIKSILNYED